MDLIGSVLVVRDGGSKTPLPPKWIPGCSGRWYLSGSATSRQLGTPTNAGYSVARDGGSCLHGLGAPTPGSRTGSTATLDDSWANAPHEAHGQRNMDDEVLR
jgi:hypothetical protein